MSNELKCPSVNETPVATVMPSDCLSAFTPEVNVGPLPMFTPFTSYDLYLYSMTGYPNSDNTVFTVAGVAGSTLVTGLPSAYSNFDDATTDTLGNYVATIDDQILQLCFQLCATISSQVGGFVAHCLCLYSNWLVSAGHLPGR